MEDKKEIIKNLTALVKQTRAGSDIEYICLDETEEFATINYENGYQTRVCIGGDSGIALIRDITRVIN